jgi:hypothetical protein
MPAYLVIVCCLMLLPACDASRNSASPSRPRSRRLDLAKSLVEKGERESRAVQTFLLSLDDFAARETARNPSAWEVSSQMLQLRRRKNLGAVLSELVAAKQSAARAVPEVVSYVCDRSCWPQTMPGDAHERFLDAVLVLEANTVPDEQLGRIGEKLCEYPYPARLSLFRWLGELGERGAGLLLSVIGCADEDASGFADSVLSEQLEKGGLRCSFLTRCVAQKLAMPEMLGEGGPREELTLFVPRALSTAREKTGWENDKSLAFCLIQAIRGVGETDEAGFLRVLRENETDIRCITLVLEGARRTRAKLKRLLPQLGEFFLRTPYPSARRDCSFLLVEIGRADPTLREQVAHLARSSRDTVMGRRMLRDLNR